MNITLFISYAHDDEKWVQAFVDLLPNTTYQVWYDHQLHGGMAWWNEIIRQIQNQTIFIYAVSSTSLNSVFCQAEYGYAKALHKPILPLVVSKDEFQIPSDILALQYILAADLENSATRQKIFHSLKALKQEHASYQLPSPLPTPPDRPILPIEILGDQVRKLAELSANIQIDLVHDLAKIYDWNGQHSNHAKTLLQQIIDSNYCVDAASEDAQSVLSHTPRYLRKLDRTKPLVSPESSTTPPHNLKNRRWVAIIFIVFVIVICSSVVLLYFQNGDEGSGKATHESDVETPLSPQTEEVVHPTQMPTPRLPTCVPALATEQPATATWAALEARQTLIHSTPATATWAALEARQTQISLMTGTPVCVP